MHRLIVFDDGKGQLAPLTDLRAVFDVRTGALTTLERVVRVLQVPPVALWVPEELTALVRQGHAAPVNGTLNFDTPVLLYNGRCPLPPPELASLTPGQVIIEEGSGDMVAACVKPAHLASVLRDASSLGPPLRAAPPVTLMSRPWHVRRFRDRCLELDLALLCRAGDEGPLAVPEGEELFESPAGGRPDSRSSRPGVLRLGGHPIRVMPEARVWPGAILDAESGPIVIDDRAIVRPGATIIGPVYVGPGSSVLERATVRANTAIGPHCKVNGEVGGVIFQGYANKAHDGYLGDSWVGEWVNLGAGTTGSNLLNTYGIVPARATPQSRTEATGERFLGSIIGDHVKTAICTRLMTGTVLHTGGMFATTAAVEGCTPRFAWKSDHRDQRYQIEKFIETARIVMERRRVTPTEAYVQRLRALHALA